MANYINKYERQGDYNADSKDYPNVSLVGGQGVVYKYEADTAICYAPEDAGWQGDAAAWDYTADYNSGTIKTGGDIKAAPLQELLDALADNTKEVTIVKGYYEVDGTDIEIDTWSFSYKGGSTAIYAEYEDNKQTVQVAIAVLGINNGVAQISYAPATNTGAKWSIQWTISDASEE